MMPAMARVATTSLFGACLLSAALAAPASARAAHADFVFRNGAVYTVTTEKPWAEAVAVSKGTIVYVGSDKDVQSLIGSKTQVIDLQKGMLLPGFVDSHVHISGSAAFFDASLTLRGATPDEVLAAVRKYVDEHPEENMIRGRGFIVESFLPDGPNKQMLDKIVPDRPAVIRSIDGHFMWVNSKALELAGITRDTPEPQPGKSWFQRDPATGEPNGYVIEDKAMMMILKALEAKGFAFETPERLAGGLKRGLPALASMGITTVFDAGSREQDFYPVLHRMEKKGELPVRVFGSYRIRPGDEEAADHVAGFLKLKRDYHSDLLAARMMKVFLDGSDNNHTAFMLDAYVDDPTTHGEPLWSKETFNSLLTRADAAGIDLHIHAVGDATIRMALDGFALAAGTNGSRDRRNALTHVNFTHPDDIVRFRQLGVIWNSTLAWKMMSPRNITIEKAMGEKRFAERIHRVQTPIDMGVIMNFSSDAGSGLPGAWDKPLDHIEIGHTRQALGDPTFRVQPDINERGKIADLIRGYTINGAYMLRMEDKIGSISVGKRADLVVLGKNLFEVSPYEIHTVPIRLTMMDGKVTHRAEAAAAAK